MNQTRGFIALMSVLIISAVLMLIAASGSFSGFYGRVSALGFENKERSHALAYACVQQTLLALAHDATYSGEATTTVSATDTCYTGAVTKSGMAPNDIYSFRTRALINASLTSLAVSANESNLSVESVQEVSTW